MFGSGPTWASVLINGSGGVWIADHGLFQSPQDHDGMGFRTRWNVSEVLFATVAPKPADILAFATLVVVDFTGREPFERVVHHTACLLVLNGERPENEKPVDVQGSALAMVSEIWFNTAGRRPPMNDLPSTM